MYTAYKYALQVCLLMMRLRTQCRAESRGSRPTDELCNGAELVTRQSTYESAECFQSKDINHVVTKIIRPILEIAPCIILRRIIALYYDYCIFNEGWNIIITWYTSTHVFDLPRLYLV